MLRKTIVALAAVASLGAAALIPNRADAAPFHRGGTHGAFHAGWRGHFAPPLAHRHRFGLHRHGGFAHRVVPFRHRLIAAPIIVGDPCVRVRPGWTAWGWRWERVWVCG